jgi:hypothetical protein
MVSTEYYDITAVSGNKIRIICKGSGVGQYPNNMSFYALAANLFSIGPNVNFNTTIVNFNDVAAGTTVTRPLYIYNNCMTQAFYQVGTCFILSASSF